MWRKVNHMHLCFISVSVHTHTACLQIRSEISTLISSNAKAQKGRGGTALLLVLKQPTSSDFSQGVLSVFFLWTSTGKLVHWTPSRLMFIPLPEQTGVRPWQTQVCSLILGWHHCCLLHQKRHSSRCSVFTCQPNPSLSRTASLGSQAQPEPKLC